MTLGQNDLKHYLGSKISTIDEDYLHNCIIVADYGNGKTNLLKYLKLYSKEYRDLNLYVSYKVADENKPDIILNILNHIETQFKEKFLEIVLGINSEENPKEIYEKILKGYTDFYAIHEYIDTLSNERDIERLTRLFFLGTGRLYTKRSWHEFELAQLTDFERKEILILFLNILSYGRVYIIFEIDELEKVREKSIVRFRNFLTSYRELIDVSHSINGHLIIVAMSSHVKNKTSIFSENPAFNSRIEKFLIVLTVIKTREEVSEFIDNFKKLFELKITEKDTHIANIIRKMRKLTTPTNRDLVKIILHEIRGSTFDASNSFIEILNRNIEIKELFDLKFDELLNRGSFKNIDNKIFDPLSHYLSEKAYTNLDENLDKRHRILRIPEANKIIYWNFSEATLDSTLRNILNNENFEHKIILKSNKYELHSDHPIYNQNKFSVFDFDPEHLLVLLELHYDYMEYAKVLDLLISSALHGVI